jgi:hypothetical protein
MNQQQITGVVRIILAAGTPLGAFLSAKGFDPQSVQDWVIAGIPIVMGVWSLWANNHANQAKAAGNIEGVKVVVSQTAPEAVQEVAKDKSAATKNVVMATGAAADKPPGRGSSPR